MSAVHAGPDGPVLGLVDGEPVSVELLAARIRLLYQGSRAAGLPVAGTREGRQFRRWVAQVVLTEALLDAECRRRGLVLDPAPLVDLDGVGRVELGSVDTAALESSAAARAVYRACTADVAPTVAEVAEYERRYADRYRTPEVRVVAHVLGADPGAVVAMSTVSASESAADRLAVRRGELPGPVDAVAFAADVGGWSAPVRSALGWHLVRVEEVRAAVAPDPARLRALVVAELTPGARRRHYRGWVDRRRAAAVRVSRGYEHPADPGQPDHLHQH